MIKTQFDMPQESFIEPKLMKKASIWLLVTIGLLGAGEKGRSQPGRNSLVTVVKVAEKGGHKIKIDSKKNIYILNQQKHDIMVLDPKFKLVRRIGGWGQGPAEFYLPFEFDIDGVGRIWVVDHFNKRIQILDHEGNFLNEIIKNNSIISIRCLSNNQVYVNNTTPDGVFARLDQKNGQLKSFGNKKIFSWLGPLIREMGFDEKERTSMERGYEAFLNSSMVRSDNSNNIYLLYLYAPVLRKYDYNGHMLLDVEIESPEIDSLAKEGRLSIKANIAEHVYGSKVLFQDIYAYSEERIFILCSGSGMFILNGRGRVLQKIQFVDEKTKEATQFAGLTHYGGDQWLGVNAHGLYMFRIKEGE